MSLEDIYLNLTDNQIDNLLLGFDLDYNNKKEENEDKLCISCNSDKLTIDNAKGYNVCSDCGVINDESSEKSGKYDFCNTSNYFFPQSSLGTKIASKGYNKLSMIQKQGQMPYREKSLLQVIERIQDKCKKYNINQPIIDSAKNLYKKISDCKHTKGKRKGKNMIIRCINRRSMIAACVFYACKLQKEPRSPKELADIYDLDVKHVNRGCKKFNDYIDLSSIFFEIKISQSTDFIERYAKKLNLDKKFIDITKNISTNIHKLKLVTTHEPTSVAAGCLLLVSNEWHLDLQKKDISEIFGISDVTISKTYRKIFQYKKIIISNELTNLILEKKNNEKSVGNR
jgi:transcription initiation factor TFIIIB Brf1 subunit/transcription initiation factor TFIIB